MRITNCFKVAIIDLRLRTAHVSLSSITVSPSPPIRSFISVYSRLGITPHNNISTSVAQKRYQNELTVITKEVTAWFKPHPFNLEKIVSSLSTFKELGIYGTEHCWSFPSDSHTLSQTCSNSEGIPNSTDDSSSGKCPYKASLSRHQPHRPLEFVVFKMRGELTGANINNTIASEHEKLPWRTYVVFQEGTLVGWDSQWPEIVTMRAVLDKISEESSFVTKSYESKTNNSNSHTGTLDLSVGATSAVDTMKFDIIDNIVCGIEDERKSDVGRSFIDAANDRIILGDNDARSKVPFSYVLAQSVKLDALDASVSPLALQIKLWQQQLAASGKLLCDLKSLRKSKTKVLSLVEALNFRHNVQTTPKLFWSGELQALRGVYREACDHLEIEERGMLLKGKLETVDESLTYLHDEIHANTMEILTWVIIILIATELFIGLHVFQNAFWLLSSILAGSCETNESAQGVSGTVSCIASDTIKV
eukprot:Tbor_TRINITY_DN3941_c0_g1::TRINITY_DN3941_c0_g1_i1::g.806::m.806